ncbi:transposon Tn3 resolvase [Lachnospiraceae bacterium]|nr:transposon Tn3 resolvase [Lachnospiraceae bacterium]
MKKISRIEPVLPVLAGRKKVAAYARVSRDTERLMNSVSAQVSYYSALIQNNPEWEYAGVYADCGISGTGKARRSEFLRMLADCEAGRINIILTKSISRFARNTVDLLETVRHLKSLGIEVRFEKEHINSLSEDGELMLSLLASFAQEESRSISENVKWGVRRRFQSGEIGTANKHILGYRFDEEKQKYTIIPEEAETVRRIFAMYLEGRSLREIAGELNAAGLSTVKGCKFSEGSLNVMIRNEAYAGDIRRQKCYMADPITKTKVKNCGELPQYYMADCHEAIIDRETYAKVQAEMERRAGLVNPAYPFTGKMKCGICGNCFTRKKGTVRGKTYVHWICRSKKETGMSCTSVNFSEEELERISAQALGMDEFDGAVFEKAVRGITVMENGDLEFHLTGGETKVWKNLHLDPPRHIATVTDCFQRKIRCAACGNTYHRVNGAGKWVYWYCIGKKRKNVECHNPNYTDYKLRQVSAHMMGLEEFSEAEFEERIEEITAFPDGSLEFHFKEGRAEKWQRA